MTDNRDSYGVARYPVGTLPIMAPDTCETLVDSEARRSFTTSIAHGPTIGRNNPRDYPGSSYRANARGRADGIVAPHTPPALLGKQPNTPLSAEFRW
jgi:hypothetical protein